jgi:hypothetical protein
MNLNVQRLYGFSDLVKPIVLDYNDLVQFDSDILVSEKLDGERCLGHLVQSKLTLIYSNREVEWGRLDDSREMYLDLEVVGSQLVVLDVLYCDVTLYYDSLEDRMRSKPDGLCGQVYLKMKCIDDLPRAEGYVFQRNSSPYGVEVWRYKFKETGDFLVHKGRLQMGLPCPMSYTCKQDISAHEGKIVEVYLLDFSFFRLRPDKSSPNSSVDIARCMTTYRASIEQIFHVSRNMDEGDYDSRVTVSPSTTYYKDSMYGKVVRESSKEIPAPQRVFKPLNLIYREVEPVVDLVDGGSPLESSSVSAPIVEDSSCQLERSSGSNKLPLDRRKNVKERLPAHKFNSKPFRGRGVKKKK